MKRPKYAIVNDIDSPAPNHIAQLVGGRYYYMSRKSDPRMKEFDGMNPSSPTAIEDFGFAILERGPTVTFSLIRDSIAIYPDRKPRRWQHDARIIEWPTVKVRSKHTRGATVNA